MISHAIQHYHTLLNNSRADDAIERLREGTARQRLTFGTRPICNVLRPMFVSAAQYEYIRRDSALVMSAIEKLCRALLVDAGLRAQLALTSDEERIIQIEPGFRAPDMSGRLDAFLDGGGEFRFVEYNADSPGGLLFGDALLHGKGKIALLSLCGVVALTTLLHLVRRHYERRKKAT